MTFTVVLPPGGTVMGKAAEVNWNCAGDADRAVMIRLPLPVLLMAIGKGALVASAC